MGYTDLVGRFEYKQPLLRSLFDALGENDEFLRQNSWEAGTHAVFPLSVVPVGWTQYTGINDRFLRVVSNLGGSVGGITGGSQLVSAGLPLVHSHTIGDQGTHTHKTSTHSIRHVFVDGRTCRADTVLLSKSPRLFGIGDVNTVWNQNGTGSTGPGNWKRGSNRGLDLAVSESGDSTSAGNHGHTINSALSDIFPAYLDVIVGIKDSVSGYTDMTDYFNHNGKIVEEAFRLVGGLYGNDNHLNTVLTPAGTELVFFLGSPPSGWGTALFPSNRALRVVSGAGAGWAGSFGISNPINYIHNHSMSLGPDHDHVTASHRHNVNAAVSGDLNYRTLLQHASMEYAALTGLNEFRATAFGSGVNQSVLKGRSTLGGAGLTTGLGGSHNHSVSYPGSIISFRYIDIISSVKLSTGAPYPFADLSLTVQFKKLVSKQRLDKFAQNDEYIRYHTMPSGARSIFYQSAIPRSWSLISTTNGAVLRVAVGAGGGSGGSFDVANAIVTQHTHSFGNASHSHAVPSHDHELEHSVQSVGNFLSFNIISSGYSHYAASHNPYGSGDRFQDNNPPDPNAFVLTKFLSQVASSNAAVTDSNSHNHGGVTSSALGSISFAYANVILCQKD